MASWVTLFSLRYLGHDAVDPGVDLVVGVLDAAAVDGHGVLDQGKLSGLLAVLAAVGVFLAQHQGAVAGNAALDLGILKQFLEVFVIRGPDAVGDRKSVV